MPAVSATRDGQFACRCGAALGSTQGNWKDHVLASVVDPTSVGPNVHLHEELELRAYACGECASLLEVEVTRKNAPSLHDMELAN